MTVNNTIEVIESRISCLNRELASRAVVFEILLKFSLHPLLLRMAKESNIFNLNYITILA